MRSGERGSAAYGVLRFIQPAGRAVVISLTSVAFLGGLIGSPSADAAGSNGDADAASESRETATAGPNGSDPSNRLWAYQPLGNPSIPEEGLQEPWVQTPIDAFIAQKLRDAGLEPAGRADRRTLIRRASFDLRGLPPTPEEIEAFLQADSPEAFDRLIDRLLADPRYGEQWGQHWLDVVRYADTAGFSNDFERPNAWRYRDYVIRSFNQDKPFDRLAREQLAGDELDPENPDNLMATGYLRMGPWEHTGMSVKAETRQQYLDDITHNVGTTFLAQGLQCAKCHDHKFDPIPTREYYEMQAVFAPVQFADREAPFQPWENTNDFQPERERIRRVIQEARQTIEEINQKHEEAVEDFLADRGVDDLEALPEEERPRRHFGLTTHEMGLKKISRKRIQRYRHSLHRFDPYALSVYNGPPRRYRSNRPLHPMPDDTDGPVQSVAVLEGGSLQAKGEEVTPGVLDAIQEVMPTNVAEIPETAHGRRLALARWITHPENPLTARVLVNRVWQYHFGNQGIVRTPNTFGHQGESPTHPELLDWLARWFMDHDWSLKALHRLIMRSATYQRRSGHPEIDRIRETDPENRLLAHYPVRRLTAEELRDSMLAVAGELNAEMGGPGIFPEINMQVALQPRHVMGTVAPPYQPSPEVHQRHRRSIYVFRERTLKNPFMKVFNRPDSDDSCARREATTIATQALELFNGQFTHDRALAMADNLIDETERDKPRLELAFLRCYGRLPSDREQRLLLDHLGEMKAHHRQHEPEKAPLPTEVEREMVEELTGEPYTFTDQLDRLGEGYERNLQPWEVNAETRAWKEVCLVLLNSNEFLYVE